MSSVVSAEDSSTNIYINKSTGVIINNISNRSNSVDDGSGLLTPTIGIYVKGGSDILIQQVANGFDDARSSSSEFERSGGNSLKYYGQQYSLFTNSLGGKYHVIDGDSIIAFFEGGNTGTMAIGTFFPNQKAILDINSTQRGLLIPRMTVAQRDALSSPPNGLIIYNYGTNSLNWTDGSVWWFAAGGQLTFDATALVDTVVMPNAGVTANSIFLVSPKTPNPDTTTIISWSVTNDTLFVYRNSTASGALNYSYVRVR